MKKVGLTGNIGSGKSFIAEILAKMGYPVYNADKEASRMMETPEAVMQIMDRFGTGILSPDGLPDRQKIAAIVFSDPEALLWLNRLIHPMVMADFRKWVGSCGDPEFCFMESAILFEHDLARHFDGVILVAAPEELSIRRVMDRDRVTAGQVQARIGNQWPADRKRAQADYTIENDEQALLLPQVLAALKKIGGKPRE